MSTHYEERLQRDLDWIGTMVEEVGGELVSIIDNAASSVLALDRQLSAETVLGDFVINRKTREIDRLCHAFVARHLPSAGHLRYVSSVLRLNIALERIGDYAATISRTAAQLSATPPKTVARDIQTMSEQARSMLSDALQSYSSRDVQQAKSVLKSARNFAPYFDRVFDDLAKEGDKNSRPIKDLFSLLATLNRLERVIHQAKNVCEETIFVVTGESKGEKKFQILFLDEGNDGASQLAEHFTTKAFPNSGKYESAGWSPKEQISPDYARFAGTVGLDLSKAWPTDLKTRAEQFDDFDLVVCLTKATFEKLPRLPFHTTALTWEIDIDNSPELVYRQLTPQIRELMDRLRGEQAS
ncbi:MAG: PhoU domain-containing protein [Planctomycetota bacterium]